MIIWVSFDIFLGSYGIFQARRWDEEVLGGPDEAGRLSVLSLRGGVVPKLRHLPIRVAEMVQHLPRPGTCLFMSPNIPHAPALSSSSTHRSISHSSYPSHDTAPPFITTTQQKGLSSIPRQESFRRSSVHLTAPFLQRATKYLLIACCPFDMRRSDAAQAAYCPREKDTLPTHLLPLPGIPSRVADLSTRLAMPGASQL